MFMFVFNWNSFFHFFQLLCRWSHLVLQARFDAKYFYVGCDVHSQDCSKAGPDPVDDHMVEQCNVPQNTHTAECPDKGQHWLEEAASVMKGSEDQADCDD